MRIAIGKLEVTKQQYGDEKGKNRCNVFGFEAKGAHCHSQVGYSNGVVAERTRWKTVATGRGVEGIIGNIFKVEMIPFCRSCTGKELVENMVGAFFMS